MSFVEPAARRSRSHRANGVLHVEIPMRRSPLLFISLLVGLAFSGFIAGHMLRNFAGSGSTNPMEWVAVAVFLAMPAWVAVLLCVTWFGRERVQVSRAGLVIRLEVLGVGFTNAYDPDRVTYLRWDPRPPSEMARAANSLFSTAIAFDHGSKTVRFGRGLDDAEAVMIIQELTATGALPQAGRSIASRA